MTEILVDKSIKRLVILTPILFLIHDAEEIVYMEGFLKANKERLPGFFREAASSINTLEFTAAVAVIFVFLLAICMAAVFSQKRLSIQLYAWSATLLFANGITHLLQAAVFGGYVPGMATSVILVIPVFAYILKKLSEKVFDRGNMTKMILASFVLQSPLAIAALGIGKLLAGIFR